MSALLASSDHNRRRGPFCGLLKKKEQFDIEFERASRSREAEQEIVAPESKDQGSDLARRSLPRQERSILDGPTLMGET